MLVLQFIFKFPLLISNFIGDLFFSSIMSEHRSRQLIKAISADEYPDLPVIDFQKSFSVKQTILKSMINMTSYAVSQNESKPIFTGELFDIENGKFTLVAIDGFRLAIRNENIETKDKYHFVVPKKTLQEVASLIHEDENKICNINVNERHIIFYSLFYGKAFLKINNR